MKSGMDLGCDLGDWSIEEMDILYGLLLRIDGLQKKCGEYLTLCN